MKPYIIKRELITYLCRDVDGNDHICNIEEVDSLRDLQLINTKLRELKVLNENTAEYIIFTTKNKKLAKSLSMVKDLNKGKVSYSLRLKLDDEMPEHLIHNCHK